MALKGLGIAWTGVKIASKLRTVVVGGAAAGALYMVTRAHSPKTADKALEIGKDAVDAGGAHGLEQELAQIGLVVARNDALVR